MSWSDVGSWIKDNAGTGTALVGSLLTGNVPAAIAAGVSLVSSATGSDNPNEALAQLQGNPESVVKLKELYYKNEQSIRQHIEMMKRLELEDAQSEHEQTQLTIRNGDNAESKIRWVRPAQSTVSLIAAIAYAFTVDDPSFEVMALLMALPFAYNGLRQIGKWKDSSVMQAIANVKKEDKKPTIK